MSNVQGIRLGQDFGVTDEHLGTIVEHFGPQLQSLELGNSDTGVQAIHSRLQHSWQASLQQCSLGTGATQQ